MHVPRSKDIYCWSTCHTFLSHPACFGVLPAGTEVKAVLLGTGVPPTIPQNTPPTLPSGAGLVKKQLWMDAIRTATPTDTTEEWDIINLTVDGEERRLSGSGYYTLG